MISKKKIGLLVGRKIPNEIRVEQEGINAMK
jgi:hypothetical protein